MKPESLFIIKLSSMITRISLLSREGLSREKTVLLFFKSQDSSLLRVASSADGAPRGCVSQTTLYGLREPNGETSSPQEHH